VVAVSQSDIAGPLRRTGSDSVAAEFFVLEQCQDGGGPGRGDGMELDVLLSGAEAQILDESLAALQRSQVGHYAAAGEVFTRQRLADLFDLVVSGIRARDLTAVVSYAEKVADERYRAGFDISEVQTAFNSLEEVMWRRVVAAEPPEDLAEAIGLLGTVLGAGKDALARQYVSLATHRHVPSLDLTALFEGTDSLARDARDIDD